MKVLWCPEIIDEHAVVDGFYVYKRKPCLKPVEPGKEHCAAHAPALWPV